MDRLLYRILYWIGMSHWDTGETPPEVREAFSEGIVPDGTALDLGCGTGTNVIFMAEQGRQAIGLDFVPEAISKARQKAEMAGIARRAQFLVGDVTRLIEMDLPRIGFALDMGCFHGLGSDGQRCYAEGLAKILIPGGLFLLYTLDPRKELGLRFGIRPEEVKTIFEPHFEIVRSEREPTKSRGTGSTWFWMERKEA